VCPRPTRLHIDSHFSLVLTASTTSDGLRSPPVGGPHDGVVFLAALILDLDQLGAVGMGSGDTEVQPLFLTMLSGRHRQAVVGKGASMVDIVAPHDLGSAAAQLVPCRDEPIQLVLIVPVQQLHKILRNLPLADMVAGYRRCSGRERETTGAAAAPVLRVEISTWPCIVYASPKNPDCGLYKCVASSLGLPLLVRTLDYLRQSTTKIRKYAYLGLPPLGIRREPWKSWFSRHRCEWL